MEAPRSRSYIVCVFTFGVGSRLSPNGCPGLDPNQRFTTGPAFTPHPRSDAYRFAHSLTTGSTGSRTTLPSSHPEVFTASLYIPYSLGQATVKHDTSSYAIASPIRNSLLSFRVNIERTMIDGGANVPARDGHDGGRGVRKVILDKAER